MNGFSNTTVGILCAIGSAIFNGSFTVPFKYKNSENAESTPSSPSSTTDSTVHPVVFTLYVSAGVCLSSCLIIPFLNDDAALLCFPAIVCGWIFVIGVLASFLAIEYIGMALAQGIWAGSATVVSYLWGTIVFQETPSFFATSLIGLFILIVGVVGIVFSDTIGKNRFFIRIFTKDYDDNGYIALEMAEDEENGDEEEKEEEDDDDDARVDDSNCRSSYRHGVFWACFVGIFGGSILAPTHYVPPENQGLAILPSFGIGTITLSPLILAIYICWNKVSPPLQIKKAFLPGLFSGLLWNISNLMSLMAIPIIGYSVAYPLLQSAVLISGLWGIYVFREITDQSTIKAFWCSSVVLLIGAATLAASQ